MNISMNAIRLMVEKLHWGEGGSRVYFPVVSEPHVVSEVLGSAKRAGQLNLRALGLTAKNPDGIDELRRDLQEEPVEILSGDSHSADLAAGCVDLAVFPKNNMSGIVDRASRIVDGLADGGIVCIQCEHYKQSGEHRMRDWEKVRRLCRIYSIAGVSASLIDETAWLYLRKPAKPKSEDGAKQGAARIMSDLAEAASGASVPKKKVRVPAGAGTRDMQIKIQRHFAGSYRDVFGALTPLECLRGLSDGAKHAAAKPEAPLQPLSPWHSLMAVGTGQVGGAVRGKDGQIYLLKGSELTRHSGSIKELITKDGHGRRNTVRSELSVQYPAVRIVVLNVTPGSPDFLEVSHVE